MKFSTFSFLIALSIKLISSPPLILLKVFLEKRMILSKLSIFIGYNNIRVGANGASKQRDIMCHQLLHKTVCAHKIGVSIEFFSNDFPNDNKKTTALTLHILYSSQQCNNTINVYDIIVCEGS